MQVSIAGKGEYSKSALGAQGEGRDLIRWRLFLYFELFPSERHIEYLKSSICENDLI